MIAEGLVLLLRGAYSWSLRPLGLPIPEPRDLADEAIVWLGDASPSNSPAVRLAQYLIDDVIGARGPFGVAGLARWLDGKSVGAPMAVGESGEGDGEGGEGDDGSGEGGGGGGNGGRYTVDLSPAPLSFALPTLPPPIDTNITWPGPLKTLIPALFKLANKTVPPFIERLLNTTLWLGEFRLNITEIDISGLESISQLSLLEMPPDLGKHSIYARAALDELTISARAPLTYDLLSCARPPRRAHKLPSRDLLAQYSLRGPADAHSSWHRCAVASPSSKARRRTCAWRRSSRRSPPRRVSAN